MWKDNNILIELKKLAPNLANLPKQEVFKVPKTYFEDNEHVWKNLEQEPSISVSKDNVFTLPQNYFADFPEKLNNKIANLETDQSSINKKYKTQNFSVPNKYFEQFEANLMAKIEDEAAAPLLSELELAKENTFKVPQNYFEQLSNKVLENINAETSQVLDKHSKEEAFNLPNAYFKNFEARLQERIAKEEKPDTKIIQLNPNRAKESNQAAPAAARENTLRKITRWGTAVAAVMALFVGINFWFSNNTENNSTVAFNLEAEFKKLNKKAIRAYILDNQDEFEEDAIFAAKGYYDEGYKFYDKSELEEINPEILREYFEEEIL